MTEIGIDATQYSYLVTCSDCAHWRSLRSTRGGAWRVAADHLRHVHAELEAAKAAARAARNCEHRQRITRPDNQRRPASRSDQRRPPARPRHK
ncbi:hypothetical protein PQC61_gp03 [Gordonia phage Emperor]|uniref:Uncharacterized protein n=2 Tax=root TaxID=1 RepID=A0A2Z4Q3T5_9CAUD|nr:hypothetical protein [Gordonia westfalica]YP_010674600.1 hypothetical protein PQC61_gp03 [Gordonia phage Emperor]AWY04771.1 hypothetical protein PBI_EMPEROR_3 [Gordonia phage Emperor]SDU50538.1 hypothetical protein SAMN04488548_1341660 [Gordonia westfalica]